MPQVAHKRNRERSELFAKVLKEIRKSKGLTQAQAAEASNVGRAYWAKVETATFPYSPSLSWLSNIRDGMKLTEQEYNVLLFHADRIGKELETYLLVAQVRPPVKALLALAVGLTDEQINELIGAILNKKEG